MGKCSNIGEITKMYNGSNKGRFFWETFDFSNKLSQYISDKITNDAELDDLLEGISSVDFSETKCECANRKSQLQIFYNLNGCIKSEAGVKIEVVNCVSHEDLDDCEVRVTGSAVTSNKPLIKRVRELVITGLSVFEVEELQDLNQRLDLVSKNIPVSGNVAVNEEVTSNQSVIEKTLVSNHWDEISLTTPAIKNISTSLENSLDKIAKIEYHNLRVDGECSKIVRRGKLMYQCYLSLSFRVSNGDDKTEFVVPDYIYGDENYEIRTKAVPIEDTGSYAAHPKTQGLTSRLTNDLELEIKEVITATLIQFEQNLKDNIY